MYKSVNPSKKAIPARITDAIEQMREMEKKCLALATNISKQGPHTKTFSLSDHLFCNMVNEMNQFTKQFIDNE